MPVPVAIDSPEISTPFYFEKAQTRRVHGDDAWQASNRKQKKMQTSTTGPALHALSILGTAVSYRQLHVDTAGTGVTAFSSLLRCKPKARLLRSRARLLSKKSNN